MAPTTPEAATGALPPVDDLWRPGPHHLLDAHVLALGRMLGLHTYDELRAFSLADPDAYWRAAIDFLGIVWSKRPEAYVDLSRGMPFPDWFPGGELNWVDTVLAKADDPELRDRPAVIAEREDGGGDTLTFTELAQSVRAFATGLRAQGVRRGDRIGLLMENGVEATVTLMALAHVGALVVPLFSGFGVDAIVARLRACEARGIIATTGFRRRGRFVDTVAAVSEALAALPGLELVVWKAPGDNNAPAGAITWADLAASAPDESGSERMSANDAFMVIYTSGTTGAPKGAVHTHGGFPLKIAHDAAVHFDLGPGDVFCWPADMGWIAGTLVLSCALMRGATLICYDGAPDFPDWARMTRIIERRRVTHFGSAPTLIRALASNTPASLAGDTSSLQLLITAGEGIAPEHFTWFRRHFGDGECPLINYTGGTEVSGALLSSVVVKPIRPAGFNTGSPGVDVVVVDENGRTVIDQAGELAVRAPFVGMTRSFWRDDERYMDTYWKTVPATWVHGDVAMQSADGGFFMLGRSDDTLKVAGKRLGPAEVEEIVLELPGIAEAAAVGVEDAAKGEKLVVFIIPAPGGGDIQDLAAAVTQRVEQRLGKPFKPSRVYAVSQLPKTRSTKVMRRVIKRICCGQPPGDLSALENPAALAEIEAAIGPDLLREGRA